MLTVSAYAKINLTLEVLGRRADGYHEVATVLQEIDLKDTLSFESFTKHRGITLDCRHPELEFSQPSEKLKKTAVPAEPAKEKRATPKKYKKSSNLVLEAAKLLQEEAGSRQGAAISIKKGIPIAAGLGGGASDAAATLRALNELWELSLSLDQLLRLASRLGSDIAFFLFGGTALGEGRGERVSPLPPFPPSWVVLFRPPVAVPSSKTERLYASLDPSHFSEGQFTKRMVSLLRQGGEPLPSSFCNTFERIAPTAYAGLEGHWQRFCALGADNVHLAGSGPTLFTMVRGKAQGQKLYRSLRREGLEAYLVQTMAKG
ncbi:MAG: 4-(cytidine 5'-diphospho)-2-C-methyl-D-erythritol kinase [Dehalococcoidia bacterium]|nr:4-(cytidine 5'-diphospho)-2-C-methyl-D-erythritol kinase [Dehalococcoidia bacterium]